MIEQKHAEILDFVRHHIQQLTMDLIEQDGLDYSNLVSETCKTPTLQKLYNMLVAFYSPIHAMVAADCYIKHIAVEELAKGTFVPVCLV